MKRQCCYHKGCTVHSLSARTGRNSADRTQNTYSIRGNCF
nr:MAG TPA: toxin III family protein [Caudoviricetes sp.]